MLCRQFTETGYSVLVPLDNKSHFVKQQDLDALLDVIATKNTNRYSMIVKNGLCSDVNPKDSLTALKQVKIEHGGNLEQKQRADDIFAKLTQLIDKHNPTLTRTILSCTLK